MGETIKTPASGGTKRPEDITKSPDFLWQVITFVVVLFVAALVIWVLDRWWKRQQRGGDDGVSLTNFRAMYEAGELSEEEYDRIRTKMAGKMKEKLGLGPTETPREAPPKSE